MVLEMWPVLVIGSVTFAAVCWALKEAFFGQRIFEIRVRRRGIKVRGELPRHSPVEVKEFIASLNLRSGSCIWAHPAEQGFRLRFTDDVPEIMRQRLRNFLYLPR